MTDTQATLPAVDTPGKPTARLGATTTYPHSALTPPTWSYATRIQPDTLEGSNVPVYRLFFPQQKTADGTLTPAGKWWDFPRNLTMLQDRVDAEFPNGFQGKYRADIWWHVRWGKSGNQLFIKEILPVEGPMLKPTELNEHLNANGEQTDQPAAAPAWGDDNKRRGRFFDYYTDLCDAHAVPKAEREPIRKRVLKAKYGVETLKGFNHPEADLLKALKAEIEPLYPLEMAGKPAEPPAPETPPARATDAGAIPLPEATQHPANRPVEAKETVSTPVPPAPEIVLPPQPSAIIPFDPSRAIAQAKMYADTVRVLRSDGVLKEGKDYGKIPGAGDKATLFKAGAEKLCNAFGFCPRFVLVDKVINWSPSGPLFYFQYECQLVNIETGKIVATGIGSCNSMESKYRYRWLFKNQLDDLGIKPDGLTTRKTKSGYVQYRVENDDVFSQVNTLDKMAQKRALVAATLIGANASEHFTQDVEDLPDFGYIDAEIA